MGTNRDTVCDGKGGWKSQCSFYFEFMEESHTSTHTLFDHREFNGVTP